jgi:hypothetical protein
MERKYRFQGSGRQENRVDQNGGGRGEEGWREGGREGGLEGWRVGGLEGWRVGGLEGWRVGGLEGIKHVVLQFVVGSGEDAEA